MTTNIFTASVLAVAQLASGQVSEGAAAPIADGAAEFNNPTEITEVISNIGGVTDPEAFNRILGDAILDNPELAASMGLNSLPLDNITNILSGAGITPEHMEELARSQGVDLSTGPK